MADQPEAKLPMVRLGVSDLEVSCLSLGTWQFGDPTSTYTKQTEEVEFEIVRAAFDAGINFFDTAEGYGSGESERALGKALRATGRSRDEYVVASKVSASNLSAAALIEACNRSLENLGMDYIDLYQIHWPNHDVPLAETMSALQLLLDEGKIRAVGVSNFGVEDLAEARACGVDIASNQLPYNAITRAIEFDIVQACMDANVSILAYSPLAQGLLTGKYSQADECNDSLARSRHFSGDRPKARHGEPGCEKELFETLAALRGVAEGEGKSMAHCALSWTLQQPGVASVIFGASSAAHVPRNVTAVAEPVSGETVAAITAATEGIKELLGSNPDLWDGGENSRYR